MIYSHVCVWGGGGGGVLVLMSSFQGPVSLAKHEGSQRTKEPEAALDIICQFTGERRPDLLLFVSSSVGIHPTVSYILQTTVDYYRLLAHSS